MKDLKDRRKIEKNPVPENKDNENVQIKDKKNPFFFKGTPNFEGECVTYKFSYNENNNFYKDEEDKIDNEFSVFSKENIMRNLIESRILKSNLTFNNGINEDTTNEISTNTKIYFKENQIAQSV